MKYVVQKLCVAKNCIPPGLSISNLRYAIFVFVNQDKIFI